MKIVIKDKGEVFENTATTVRTPVIEIEGEMDIQDLEKFNSLREYLKAILCALTSR